MQSKFSVDETFVAQSKMLCLPALDKTREKVQLDSGRLFAYVIIHRKNFIRAVGYPLIGQIE